MKKLQQNRWCWSKNTKYNNIWFKRLVEYKKWETKMKLFSVTLDMLMEKGHESL